VTSVFTDLDSEGNIMPKEFILMDMKERMFNRLKPNS